ncbi:MAG: DUF3501 family protein [Alphaproteobacteria bacterium]|nr:DUF3501 family protein [Alphaproteobacteria bacterium]
MSEAERRIRPADVLSLAEFETLRRAKRATLVAMKRDRRVAVGPFATFYFENYETMWWQVHEMLRIEKGGASQVADELDAYNPLIPQGRELVATLMFEIDDAAERDRWLTRLGGVEHTVTLQLGGRAILAEIADARSGERTTEGGKTSSVHFLRFAFDAEAIARFRDATQPVLLGIGHENYGHLAVLPAAVRQVLAKDFG